MFEDKTILKREDYEEPNCPFCVDQYKSDKPIKSIDINRMTAKLDEYLERDDFDSARRHLDYWQSEARFGNDLRGELAIQNELMGLNRRCKNREEADKAVARGLELVEEIGLQGTETSATTFLNVATVYNSFDEPERALEYYKKAEAIYESVNVDKYKLGGLYNNMALAYGNAGKYGEAKKMFGKAIDLMKELDNKLEEAISYLNLVDVIQAEIGEDGVSEEIDRYLDISEQLLTDKELKMDLYYAYVCDKCIPAFDYYGRFGIADELRKRVKEIYERT